MTTKKSKQFGYLLLYMLVLMIGTFFVINKLSLIEHSNRSIINVIGRQRMLTQNISKQVLLYTHEKNHAEYAKQEIVDLVSLYDDVLTGINQNKITYQGQVLDLGDLPHGANSILYELNETWQTFMAQVMLVISDDADPLSVSVAIDNIINENEKLLFLSDLLTNEITELSHVENTAFVNLLLIGVLSVGLMMLGTVTYMYLRFYNALETMYRNTNSVVGRTYLLEHKNRMFLKPLSLIRQVDSMFTTLENVLLLVKGVNSSDAFEEVFELLYGSFNQLIPYNHLSIALYSDDTQTVRSVYGMSDIDLKDQLKKMKGVSIKIHETTLYDIVTQRKPRIIDDLQTFVEKKPSSEYNKTLMLAGIRSSVTYPLILNSRVIGFIFFSSTQKKSYSVEHLKLIGLIADSVAYSLEKNNYLTDLIYTSVFA